MRRRLTARMMREARYTVRCTDCPGRYFGPPMSREAAQRIGCRHRIASAHVSYVNADAYPHEVSIHPFVRASAAGLLLRRFVSWAKGVAA